MNFLTSFLVFTQSDESTRSVGSQKRSIRLQANSQVQIGQGSQVVLQQELHPGYLLQHLRVARLEIESFFEKNKSLFPLNGDGWFHNNADGQQKQNAMLDRLFEDADAAESAGVEGLKGQAGYAERKKETKFISTSGTRTPVDGSSLRQRVAKYMNSLRQRATKKK